MQRTYLIRSKYLKHTKNPDNSILKKKKTQLKNGQKTRIDIFPKKTYICPTDI